MRIVISKFVFGGACLAGCLLWLSGGAFAQPAGWIYQTFCMKDGSPSAVFVSAGTDAEVIVHAGDSLEGHEVLTVNADRVVFRRERGLSTLLKGQCSPSKGLERRVKQLRAERTTVKHLLEDLCRRTDFELLVLGDIRGTVSVDFSNMTVREILDSLCRYASLAYMTEGDKLWVMPKGDVKKLIRL